MVNSKSAGNLPAPAVILVWTPPPGAGVTGSAEPFLLRIRAPDVVRPVAFASRALAWKMVTHLEMGGRATFSLEPAMEVMATFPTFFLSRELVYFPDVRAIDRFIGEVDFLPLREI